MVTKICPECQHGNPLENHYCGRCGASLDSRPLAPRRENSLTIAGYDLPAEQLKQVGQTVAVSLLALVAEAGLAWLRRRVGQVGGTPGAAAPRLLQRALSPKTAIVPVEPQPTGRIVSVFSRRVVSVWEAGRFVRQTVEQVTWRRE